MIINANAGKLNAVIGKFEGPLMAYMEKEEADFAKDSFKKEFFTVKSSKHYSESVAGMTGIGDFEATDGPVPFDEMEEGYSKTFIHQVFKKGIQIKRETIDDAQIIDMQNQTSNITDSANRTKERFVHVPFNFCNQTTYDMAGKKFDYTGADGKALCASDHPSKTGKAPAQSNITSLALTPSNLTTVENMFKSFVTDSGNKGNFKADTLIVPFELRDVAWEILGSSNKIGTNNNEINTKYGKYKLIISDWLENPTSWFLADSKYMRKNLYWLDRKELEVNSWIDPNTGVWNVAGYFRFVQGFNDWRWVVGNIPS